MLRDGEYVGEDAYGNREITLSLYLKGLGVDAAATQLQAFQRELDRATNVLQYSPGSATNSVFFRTYRSPLEQIRWDPDNKQLKATLLAEPFGLGLRQDIASVAVINNPAVAQGLFFDLTGIKGDVETPLLLETTTGASFFQRGLAYGVRPKGVSGNYPAIFRQAESLTMGTDTTVTADAAMSGGSKARCTFATASMQTRVSGVFPTSSVPRLGEPRRVPGLCAGGQVGWLGSGQHANPDGAGQRHPSCQRPHCLTAGLRHEPHPDGPWPHLDR